MPASKTPSLLSSKATAERGLSPREPGRCDRLVCAARRPARMAGFVVADVARTPAARARRGVGSDRRRAGGACFRLSDALPCGFGEPAEQADVGAADRRARALWLVDAVASDGAGDARLLRARRPRSDPLLPGPSLATFLRAHRGDGGDYRVDVAGAGGAVHQRSGLVRRDALA